MMISLIASTMLLLVTILEVSPLTADTHNSNNGNKSQLLLTDNETSFNVTHKTKPFLYLLVLLPYPDLKGGPQPSWSGGPNVLPAIEMAVEDVNRRTGILDSYTLDLLTGEGGCNIVTKTARGLVENVLHAKPKRPVGIVGPGCSASSLYAAPIISRDEMSLVIAHGASSPRLEDKKKYPFMFGGFSSLTAYASALAAFMRERQWTRIAVLYDNSRAFHNAAFNEFSKALSPQNNTATTIEYSSGISSSFIPIEHIINKRFLKVIVVLAGHKLVREVLCLSYHSGLSFPTHQFLIIERHLPELIQDVRFDYDGKSYSCSKEVMNNTVLEGNLLSEYSISPHDRNSSSTVNETSYNEFITEYESRIKSRRENVSYVYHDNITKSIWGSMWYDLVWAMATSLNNAEVYDGVDLQTYRVGMTNVTRKICNRFQELDFEGMSGRIWFNESSSFVRRNIDLHQITNGWAIHVAIVNGSHVEPKDEGVYTTSDYPTRVHHNMSVATTVVVLFLISVTTVALIITHLLTLKYRHNTVVKGSSPRLQHLAYAGCYVLVVATVTLIVPEAFSISNTVYIVFCHVMNTCFSCGYTLIIGTVCAKTWRLYRIFCHFQKPGKMLADHFLFAVVLLLTLTDIVVNTAWASFDHFETNTTRKFENSSDGDVVLVTTTTCWSNHHVAWTSAMISYNVCILFVAVYLAILTRKVHLPQFQTKTVVILAYVLFLLFGLGTPLRFILDSHYVWTAMFLLTILFCILLLFLPPLLTAITKRSSRQVHARNPRPSIISLFSNSL